MSIELAAVLIVALLSAVAIYALHRGYALWIDTPKGGGGALPPEEKKRK